MFKTNKKINPMFNFDISRYMGNWYELARSNNTTFEIGKYLHEEYRILSDEIIRLTFYRTINGKEEKGEADVFYDPKLPSHWDLRFLKKPIIEFWPTELIIIDTDYDNYAITYSKSSFMYIFTKEMAWIMSRKKYLSPEVMETLYKKLEESTGIKKESMILNIQ